MTVCKDSGVVFEEFNSIYGNLKKKKKKARNSVIKLIAG